MEIAAILAIVAMGCLALAGWCIWLLQRHWPKTDAAVVRELMVMNFSAFRKGREQVPVKDALAQMEVELSDMRDRAANTQAQDDFIRRTNADQAAAKAAGHVPPEEEPEEAETVAEFGTNLQS